MAENHNAAATFCATLVDEWIRLGVTQVVIAPGSRSTPLALAFATRSELELHVFHDERSAAFAALGIARSTGMCVPLLSTSGTAAAHFHATVIEARQDDVPMLVLTADRPPELHDVGAPQTIDQTHLYGRAAHWYHDPGVADFEQAATWRPLARRAVDESRIGPVHLNLAFREPLVGDVGALPTPLAGAAVGTRVLPTNIDSLVYHLRHPRGLIMTGGTDPDLDVSRLAEVSGWPVLADPRSRRDHTHTVCAFEDLLRDEQFATEYQPDVVVRFGPTPASRTLGEWQSRSGALQVQVNRPGRRIDPRHDVAFTVQAEPQAVADALAGALGRITDLAWTNGWREAETAAQQVFDDMLGVDSPVSEPGVSRTLVAAVPVGSQLMVSSSMPIRDVEWYSQGRNDMTIHANRGANGIDGVIATAIGLGLALGQRRPTTLLIGDIAFLHDSSSLTALRTRNLDLTIVVVDNDGGAIFSFLPQATLLSPQRFEQLFGTPHGTDVTALARAHGLPCTEIVSLAQLAAEVSHPTGTPRVLHVTTSRVDNVAVHTALHAAVSAALQSAR